MGRLIPAGTGLAAYKQLKVIVEADEERATSPAREPLDGGGQRGVALARRSPKPRPASPSCGGVRGFLLLNSTRLVKRAATLGFTDARSAFARGRERRHERQRRHGRTLGERPRPAWLSGGTSTA